MIVDAAEPTRIKFGAASDTHDNLNYVEATVSHFESEGVDAIVHYGGIIASFSAAPLDADFGFHVARSNNDGKWALHETVESFDTYHGDFMHLTLDGQEIAVYHGTETGLVNTFVDSEAYNFVLRGHDHERVVEHRGATTHINSGGLPIPGADDAFHVAIVDLDAGNMASRSL